MELIDVIKNKNKKCRKSQNQINKDGKKNLQKK
jgi:hypothetical protein